MTSGERIRRIREFRNMTQKELGLRLNYPENSAGIRIAQYESNTRVPKKDTAIELSKILKCNYIAIYDDSEELGPAERIMQNLFWLEELIGGSFFIFPLEKYYDKDDESVISGKYNDYNYTAGFSPIGIAFNYTLVNDFMREWAIRYEEFRSNKITSQEYFDWKINWPESCDDCGKIKPKYQWRVG